MFLVILVVWHANIYKKIFHNRLLGRGGAESCPSTSPDLSSLLWRHLKNLVYSHFVKTEERIAKPRNTFLWRNAPMRRSLILVYYRYEFKNKWIFIRTLYKKLKNKKYEIKIIKILDPLFTTIVKIRLREKSNRNKQSTLLFPK